MHLEVTKFKMSSTEGNSSSSFANGLPSRSDLRARLQGGSELKGCGGPLVGCGLPKGRGEPRTSSSSNVTSTRTKLVHQTTRPN